MLRPIFVVICSLSLHSCKTVATTNSFKSIYGEDGRQEVYDHANTPLAQLATSTAMKIGSNQLADAGNGTFKIKAKTWGEYEKVCPNERFAKQLAPGSCSGFLVAPNIIATAGHCVKSLDECRTRQWIFGYFMDSKEKDLTTIPKGNAYSCIDVEALYKRQDIEGVDLALIRLDRNVAGVKPIPVPEETEVKKGELLAMIGYPSGLPAKVVSDAATTVRETQPNYPQFMTNLDAFAGASGSAVFKTSDASLAGILSAGEDDYEPSLEECKRPRRCSNEGCMGEKVIRASALAVALRQASFASQSAPLNVEFEAEIPIPAAGDKIAKISLPVATDVPVDRVSLVFSVRHIAPSKLRAMLTHPDGKTTVGQLGLDANNIWRWSSMYRMSKFLDLSAKGDWILTIEDTTEGNASEAGVVSNISLTIN